MFGHIMLGVCILSWILLLARAYWSDHTSRLHFERTGKPLSDEIRHQRMKLNFSLCLLMPVTMLMSVAAYEYEATRTAYSLIPALVFVGISVLSYVSPETLDRILSPMTKLMMMLDKLIDGPR